MLPQTPHFSDLNPGDFFLLPELKEELNGKVYQLDISVVNAMHVFLEVQ